jgi:hypothetical protein
LAGCDARTWRATAHGDGGAGISDFTAEHSNAVAASRDATTF